MSSQKPGLRFVRQLNLAPGFAEAGGLQLRYRLADGGNLQVLLGPKQAELFRQDAAGKAEKLLKELEQELK